MMSNGTIYLFFFFLSGRIILGRGTIMNKNKYSNVFETIVIFVLYFMWPYFLSAIFSFFDLSGNISLVLKFVLNFVLLFIIIIILKGNLREDFKLLKKDTKKKLISGLLIFLVGFIIYGILNICLLKFFPVLRNSNFNYQSMAQFFKTIPILFFISVIFYYPVIEELVFKNSLRKIITNKWAFIIITGFLNAFFQIILTNYTTLLYLFYLIPFSILYMSFSYIYYKTESVYIAIFYRMLFNIIPTVGNIILSYLIINF